MLTNLDSVGILFDFGNVKEIQKQLDHRFLNELKPFEKINPTAENICIWIYDQLHAMAKNEEVDLQFKVRVYETPLPKETWCECGDWE